MDQAEQNARKKGEKKGWGEDKIQRRATMRRTAKEFFTETLPAILLTRILSGKKSGK